MAKKHRNDWEDDASELSYNSGKFIDSERLFDKHDDEDDDEIDEDTLDESDSELEDDEKIPYLDELEDDPEAVEKPKKKRVMSKPKLIGKHSLTYDTIFKGKKNVVVEEDAFTTEHIIKNAGGSLDINDNEIEFEESRNSIDSYREIRLKHEINILLKNNTDINFTANRRKPAKTDFNAYFSILLKDLIQYGYTRTEIFIELSGYFSDNIWNMFLLLDKQYSNIIIKELKDKYGLSAMDQINFVSDQNKDTPDFL